MNFITSTRAELLKTKRSAAFWLSVLGALFIPAIFFMMYYFKPEVFIPMLKGDPWQSHFLRGWQSLSAFLLPMFIILVCSLIPQIEYKNNTWKQVFASPQSFGSIFFSKFLTIHLMILFCFTLFTLFMILSALTVNMVNEKFPFLNNAIDLSSLLKMVFKTYVSVLGISAIQYWLGLRFRNFITPIGIGLGLLITSLIIMQWKHIDKVPYAFPILTLNSLMVKPDKLLVNHELNSIGYFLVFMFIGFFDMKFRKEKG
jgi:hypothetical protein